MKYQCTTCGAEYNEFLYRCPKCATDENPPKGILKVVYDYTSQAYDPDTLIADRFLPFLPIESYRHLSPLNVGNTPLYKLSRGKAFYLKDDSRNPTFSYKDRASDIVCAFAAEKGYEVIAAASTGNAGSSLAGIAASNGQKAIVFAPAKAPKNKLLQILAYGAKLIPVDGTYDDAFDLCARACEEQGWFNRNTAWNPLTIEGKKTCAFELYADFSGQAPSDVFVPVGDGVIIAGIYRGFEDLMLAGLIPAMPRIHAVQSLQSDNLIRNLFTKGFQMQRATTFADSISVDYPRNFYMTRDLLRKYNGNTIAVTDDEIRDAMRILARDYGIFSEPAAAAAFAGFLKQKDTGETPVVLNTGCGLKDPSAFAASYEIPPAVRPDIESSCLI